MEVEEENDGEVTLPKEFGVINFIEHRINEISNLTKAIQTPKMNALVFQRLPIHMRRRVMGHTSKRMPRSVREAHINQLKKSGFPPKSKRPSRRYRRRPKNLLSEYNRRQKTHVWLETHIWHAKRFHMCEKWGYKLPLHSNDKSVRACYRAAANHCLLHDMSYLVCIELQGTQSTLTETLSHLCNPACGLTFASKHLLCGNHEGKIMLYREDKYPYEGIGQVSFLWKPPSNEDTKRNIWIWCHPSHYEEVVTEFKSLFKLEKTEEIKEVIIGEGKEAEKLSTRIPPPVFRNVTSEVEMVILKDVIGRFRLTGPLAHAILQSVLIPPIIDITSKHETKSQEIPMDIDDIFSSVLEPTSTPKIQDRAMIGFDGWGAGYYNTSQHQEEMRTQSQLWQNLGGITSPAQMPPNCVLGLTVLDPRLSLPAKRTKAIPNATPLPSLAKLPEKVSSSPLWNYKIRALVTAEKKTDFEINSSRSNNLVPGWCNQELPTDATKVPVLLIQSPGSQDSSIKKLGLGCSWDIILPAGWNMPFLRSLILQGARVGGLRELEAFGTESLVPFPPLCAPDTTACQLEQENKTRAAVDEYFKRPPNKRPNYIKLGISCPFGAPWSQLVKEWNSDIIENFYVLRDRKKLINIKEALNSNVEYLGNDPNCLIMVTTILNKGGALDSWSLISLPESNEDLSNQLFEVQHIDANEVDRKEIKVIHQKEIKSLSRKRSKCRKNDKPVKTDDADNKSKEFEAKMRMLWLPPPSNLKDLCDRKTAGFICNGMYSNSEARSAGVGFITEPALQVLLKTKSWNKNADVLVRNIHSLNYRVAKLKVLIP